MCRLKIYVRNCVPAVIRVWLIQIMGFRVRRTIWNSHVFFAFEPAVLCVVVMMIQCFKTFSKCSWTSYYSARAKHALCSVVIPSLSAVPSDLDFILWMRGIVIILIGNVVQFCPWLQLLTLEETLFSSMISEERANDIFNKSQTVCAQKLERDKTFPLERTETVVSSCVFVLLHPFV